MVRKEHCPRCRENGRDTAGDNLVVYEDGSVHCFACGYHPKPNQSRESMEGKLTLEEIALLPCTELACRGISEDAAKFFGVRTSFDAETGEADAFFFPLYRGKELVGYQKKLARPPGGRQRRDTVRVGETKGALPFGAHRAGSGGKMVVVVEGAEDALAAYQMLAAKGKKYRVVSTLGTDGWEQNLE